MSTLDRPAHLEQAQHCTDMSHEVTFQVPSEHGKMKPGLR